MSDLISRSALLKELVFDYAYAAADVVKAAPAVDAVPVVHGNWGEPFKVDAENNGYKCSECGYYGVPCWNYCPNCGAKMDGERKDSE